jgi:tape measure domain-containing protein
VAQSTVRLIVDAQNAIRPLQRVNEQTKTLSKSTDKLKGRLDKSNKSLRDTGSSARTASKGVNGLVSALRPLLAALAVVGTGKFVIFQTAELERQTKALTVLTGSAETAKQIVQEIKEFGAVTPFKSSELIEVAKRMKAFGFETENVVDITKRIADIAGTAGADIDGVALAIGKVQAKNKFMQEENIMLLEKGINVTKELEKITGMTGEELAKAMSKGEVGADKFREAIIRLTSKNGEFFGGAQAQSDTLFGKFSTLIDGVETLAQRIGEKLEPALKGALDVAIDLVTNINQAIAAGSITDTDKKALKKQADEIITEQAGRFPGGPFGMGEVSIDFQGKTFKGQPASVSAQITNLLINKEVAKRLKEQLRIQKKLTKETKKTTEKTTENVTPNEKIKNINLDILRGEEEREDLLKKNEKFNDLQIKSLKEITTLEAKLSGKKEEQITLEQKINEIKKEFTGEDAKQLISQLKNIEALKEKLGVMDENSRAAEELKNKFDQIGVSIESNIKDNLRDAITGAQSFGQAMTNVLNRIRDKIIDAQLDRLVGGISENFSAGARRTGGRGIGGFLGGLIGGLFANGGRPPVGKASIVGERGPELFVPKVAGTIIPNNAIGGGDNTTNMVTVNVDASGSSVAGNSTDAQALGAAIGAAVQAQLIKEKRPGGLLTR